MPRYTYIRIHVVSVYYFYYVFSIGKREIRIVLYHPGVYFRFKKNCGKKKILLLLVLFYCYWIGLQSLVWHSDSPACYVVLPLVLVLFRRDYCHSSIRFKLLLKASVIPSIGICYSNLRVDGDSSPWPKRSQRPFALLPRVSDFLLGFSYYYH